MDELIAKYFENTLSDSEKVLFDKELLENHSFKSEFEFQKELKNAISASERQKIKRDLQQFQLKNSPIFKLKKYLPYAAILIIGLCMLYVLTSKPDYETLYSENFTPYPNVIEPISRSNKERTLKTLAFESYELGAFDVALKSFNNINEKGEDKVVVNLYKANIFLSQNKPDSTIVLLRENLKTPSNWQDKNLWYLALAYLKTNQLEKCKETLMLLDKEQNNFKEKETLRLLKSLD